MNLKKTAYRGRIFYFKDSATFETVPRDKTIDKTCDEHVYCYIEDGVLVVDSTGKVEGVHAYDNDTLRKLKDTEIIDYKGKLITPGFIDAHNHACQSSIVAAYGRQLLEWLNNYVFPAESKYKNAHHARAELSFFLDLLLKNGTTTAVSFGPVFHEATDIFFEELQKRNMRYITGNTMMDDNSPDSLCLPAEACYDISKQLIQKWHGNGRLSFCISPRFALACSEKMLEMSGTLAKENPTAYVQTHLNENMYEVKATSERFPWAKNYLDIYDHYGLVTDRALFGHCIHMTESELELMQARQATLVLCPTSNNFLGSGLFDFERATQYTDRIAFATDWGAGNTLSMFRVMDDGYKVAMLKDFKLPSMVRWYLCTLGAARVLQLNDKIGNFEKGKEADFIVIDPDATEILKYRNRQVEDIFELLFVIMALADQRNIQATYVMGKLAYSSTHQL